MQLTALVILSLISSIALGGVVKEQASDLNWWKQAVFYQIYPRSFEDSNNDGIGDLQGIISKLDFFQTTGIDAVWLSPIFKSPQVDQGYDISDYRDVDPDYGTMDDLQELIKEAHVQGTRVILDFVPNHTSDKHQWFIDSVNGVEDYRDYYVWANAKTDENGNRLPPNNWISIFKNSAWAWSEERQQYYLHQFASAQPDLNYRNPKVVEEMKDVLRFWLDQGVDGFRIDAIPCLFEAEGLPDEPESGNPGYSNTDYEYLNHIYTSNLPETFDMVYQWRQLVDEYTQENSVDQKVLMTEVYADESISMLYYGNGSRLGAHFSFNFNFIKNINIDSTAQEIVNNAIKQWLDSIPEDYTSNWVLGNHDNHRVATRLGPSNVDGFNMLNLLLPGVAVTYNGEEIGQEDGAVSYEEGQDPSARDPSIFEQVSRDFERTPYQWDDTVNAGFNTGAKPWLPVSEKYQETNLEQELEGEGPSHFKVYLELVKFRNSSAEITSGDVEVEAVGEYVILLKRSYKGSSTVLVFNKGDEDEVVNVEDYVVKNNMIQIISVDSPREVGSAVIPNNLTLEAHEALVISFLKQ